MWIQALVPIPGVSQVSFQIEPVELPPDCRPSAMNIHGVVVGSQTVQGDPDVEIQGWVLQPVGSGQYLRWFHKPQRGEDPAHKAQLAFLDVNDSGQGLAVSTYARDRKGERKAVEEYAIWTQGTLLPWVNTSEVELLDPVRPGVDHLSPTPSAQGSVSVSALAGVSKLSPDGSIYFSATVCYRTNFLRTYKIPSGGLVFCPDGCIPQPDWLPVYDCAAGGFGALSDIYRLTAPGVFTSLSRLSPQRLPTGGSVFSMTRGGRVVAVTADGVEAFQFGVNQGKVIPPSAGVLGLPPNTPELDLQLIPSNDWQQRLVAKRVLSDPRIKGLSLHYPFPLFGLPSGLNEVVDLSASSNSIETALFNNNGQAAYTVRATPTQSRLTVWSRGSTYPVVPTGSQAQLQLDRLYLLSDAGEMFASYTQTNVLVNGQLTNKSGFAYVRPALSLVLSTSTNQLPLCSELVVTGRVTCHLTAALRNVAPVADLELSDTNAFLLLSGPTPNAPVTLNPETSQTFVWRFRAIGAGESTFSLRMRGTNDSGAVESLPVTTLPVTVLSRELIVNSLSDDPDVDPADGCCSTGRLLPDGTPECSLRAAIETINRRGGTNHIQFAIPGAGVPRILPRAALPFIQTPVDLDGESQPGGWVEISGDLASDGISGKDSNGIVIGSKAPNSRVHGLVINGFKKAAGLILSGGSAIVEGCLLGTDVSGHAPKGNGAGIAVFSPSNRIGRLNPGLAVRPGNLISGNDTGIQLGTKGPSPALYNQVVGNLIGTDIDGLQSLSNRTGVAILSLLNTLGGHQAGEGNVIVGEEACIRLESAAGDQQFAIANVIEGNKIGTDRDGQRVLKHKVGVVLDGASYNAIGGSNRLSGNLIAGGDTGILLTRRADSNVISGNLIGVNATGQRALPAEVGVLLEEGSGNLIGGKTLTARNVISGHRLYGLVLGGERATAANNVISGNHIGTDYHGLHAVPNGTGQYLYDGAGLLVSGSRGSNNVISGNLISGNHGSGILMLTSLQTTRVEHNRIGTQVDPRFALGNGYDGVYVKFSKSDSPGGVGGTAADAGNVIAFNHRNGVTVGSLNPRVTVPILGNQIHHNEGWGIDLGQRLPLNDPGDADTGPNGLQNWPVLVQAMVTNGQTQVVFDLNSFASPQTFRIEFFANRSVPVTILAQGERWIGTSSVKTVGDHSDPRLNRFTASLPPQFVGTYLSATATDAAGNTSPFSASVLVNGRLHSDSDALSDELEDLVPTLLPVTGAAPPVSLADVTGNDAGYGDGNGDTIRDALQPNVVSLPSLDGRWVTFAAPAGVPIKNAKALPQESQIPLPVGLEIPLGLFSFSINASSVNLSHYVPAGIDPAGWLALSRTAEGDRWDSLGDAAPSQSGLNFQIRDGDLGDADGVVNGVISVVGGTFQVARAPSGLNLRVLGITEAPGFEGLPPGGLFPEALDYVIPGVPLPRVQVELTWPLESGGVPQWNSSLGGLNPWLTLDAIANPEGQNATVSLEVPGAEGYFRLVGAQTGQIDLLPAPPADPNVPTFQAVRTETRAGLAEDIYGVTGRGVLVAVLDRGIDWKNNDFRNADGTTRIRYIFDMTIPTGSNAPSNPYHVGTIYTREEINAALAGGPSLPTRDAVGHGTTTSGIACGGGRDDGRFRGIAPEADLLVVKVTSDGAPAHDGEAAEAAFYNPDLIPVAIDFVRDKAVELGMPCVMLLNLGSVGGPTDGTSTLARKIDATVGPGIPGLAFVSGTSDDGGAANRVGGVLAQGATIPIKIHKGLAGSVVCDLWLGADDRVSVRIVTPTATYGPYPSPVPNGFDQRSPGPFVYYHLAGNRVFYGAKNNKREIWLRIDGPVGDYVLELTGTQISSGRFDGTMNPSRFSLGAQGGNYFTTQLAPGSIWEAATARYGIVPNSYMIATNWTDLDGFKRSVNGEGLPGELWKGSGVGPTFDGRIGVDVSAPGDSVFTTYNPRSYWATFRFNRVKSTEGTYGRASAVSAANPIVLGVVALMLERNPSLDASAIKQILQASGRRDAYTGSLPNPIWGYGKLDAFEAVTRAGLWPLIP